MTDLTDFNKIDDALRIKTAILEYVTPGLNSIPNVPSTSAAVSLLTTIGMHLTDMFNRFEPPTEPRINGSNVVIPETAQKNVSPKPRRGPSRGLWYFTIEMVKRVLNNQGTREKAENIALEYVGSISGEAIWASLEYQDQLACQFARLLLIPDPSALPKPLEDNALLAWDYYRRVWGAQNIVEKRTEFVRIWNLVVKIVREEELKLTEAKKVNVKANAKPIITVEQFKKIFPKAKAEEFVPILVDLLPANGIDTLKRVSAFLSQCGHECGEFTVFVENLNYSAAGLRTTFPKYFPDDKVAEEYARKPEKIANRVYGGRMGNGPENTGDGWKYRGRGLIQITGKNNYTAYAKHANVPFEKVTEYCEKIEGIIDSAIFFWTTNSLNKHADTGDFTALTKAINGGTNGIEHRSKLYMALMTELSTNFVG